MIRAEISCDNDDYGPVIPFDATEWFRTASDADISALRAEEYGCGYESDNVAEFMADRDKTLAEFFVYLRFRQTYGSGGGGYAVRVDAYAAELWLSKNRPAIAT